MNTEPSILLSAVGENGRGLQVSFHRCGDRFAHTIAAVDGERVTPLLASVEGTNVEGTNVEGTNADPWPESPPLQEVHVEDREATGRVVLAVGRAGRSHWSLSVHAEPATETTAAALLFDVAVRLRDEPQQLGSLYRSMTAVSASSEAISSEGGSLELAVSSLRCCIEAVELAGQSTRLDPTPSGLLIAASSSGDALPRTVRWQYRVRAFQTGEPRA